jgi:6-pyruvoyltetrahydropterin/6-carboxytetrahydropterin synthase
LVYKGKMNQTRITAHRYHDFSTGHRVYQHESKCAHLHGHNYRIHFYCDAPTLDNIGRVIDFSDIKTYLCNWLEDNWDHKFLVWEKDPWSVILKETDPEGTVVVGFNPTAENMGQYLLDVVGPQQLKDSPVTLYKVIIEETRKCSATVEHIL